MRHEAVQGTGPVITVFSSLQGAYREEEEQLLQLPLGEEVGQMPHCIGPQGCDVGELAWLLSAQGCYSFYDIVCHLRCTEALIQLSHMQYQQTGYRRATLSLITTSVMSVCGWWWGRHQSRHMKPDALLTT